MFSIEKQKAATDSDKHWTMISWEKLRDKVADCYELFQVDKWQRGESVSGEEKVALEDISCRNDGYAT